MSENRPIALMIQHDGYLDNTQLWNQSMTAQVVRYALDETASGNFSVWFLEHNPKYNTWKETRKEMEALSRMTNKKQIREKELFFNKDTIADMLRQEIQHQKEKDDSLPLRSAMTDYILSGPSKRSMQALQQTQQQLQHTRSYKTIKHLVMPLSDIKHVTYAWRNAWIGNCAYYTAVNLIRFHGCRITTDRLLSEQESLDYVYNLAAKYANDAKQHHYSFQNLMNRVTEMIRQSYNIPA